MPASWSLVDTSAARPGLAGYRVLDALGLPIGKVTGWVLDATDQVAFLKAEILTWPVRAAYLLPLGTLNEIDDAAQQVRLRQLTKSALMLHCLQIERDLPAADFLEAHLQSFPPPRASILQRLQALAGGASSRAPRPPVAHHAPSPLALPQWQPLAAWIDPAPQPPKPALAWTSLTHLA